MVLQLRTDTIGNVPVVAVGGVVDLATVPHLRDELTKAIRRFPGEHLAIDLDGVGAIDDAGLGVLLGVAALARDAGGDVSFVVSNARLRDQLHRTRVDRAVSVASSASELA
ncbi:MAG: STAS domain-containing protein [Actinomycetota bacterium]